MFLNPPYLLLEQVYNPNPLTFHAIPAPFIHWIQLSFPNAISLSFRPTTVRTYLLPICMLHHPLTAPETIFYLAFRIRQLCLYTLQAGIAEPAEQQHEFG
jgi:hypothetical protein